MSLEVGFKIFMKVVAVVKYFHSEDILIMNLNPNNVFVSKDYSSVKIGDYMWSPLEEHIR